MDLAYDAYDLRIRTTLVCGALALAIAASALLRTRRLRRAHWLFGAFAGDMGIWYLSQSLFGISSNPVMARLPVALAVLLPVFLVNLLEAMVPDEHPRRRNARMGRWSWLIAAPMLVLALSPYLEFTIARVMIFLYAVVFTALGLYELGQRGRGSHSRATQRRVRFLVVTGALAGTFTVADFAWVIGYDPAYHPPPVGVVLSVVFVFLLAQALRRQRLLDLYDLLGRAVVAIVVAFIIAGLFYFLLTVVGQANTMWLNAVLVAIVVLVLLDPLRDWVTRQVRRFVFRESGRLQAALATARRRLAHTLELDDMGRIVMHALERSRSFTSAGLYTLTQDGSFFERLAAVSDEPVARIEVATARALLDALSRGPVVLEQQVRWAADADPRQPGSQQATAVLAAAEVLDTLRDRAVVFGVRGEDRELVALLVVSDERIRDAFSPEDISQLEALALQVGVVIENSRVYAKLKERDRLAVLGQMAAGLAHEIRNPLGAIKGAAQLLSEPGPGKDGLDGPDQEFVGIIVDEVDRLNAVVSSVLDLAREKADRVAPIDINAEVRRTLQVMSAEWSGLEVDVSTELDEELPRAEIAAEQLRQVLMNLLKNAAQALDGEGRVTVRTTTRNRGGQRWVALAVTDAGPGIPPAVLKKMFLPFFTTKEAGTGLGLAVCQTIVQTADGWIEVTSREEVGTTFEVVLPAVMVPTSPPGEVALSEAESPSTSDGEGGDSSSTSSGAGAEAASRSNLMRRPP